MSKAGMKLWKQDKRVFKTVFKPEPIEEISKKLGGKGVDVRRINSKEKLMQYVWDKCSEGTYDLCIYLPSKSSQGRSPMTFVRVTLKGTDKHGSEFLVTQFDTKGKKNKFGMRFGVFKRMVFWEDDF